MVTIYDATWTTTRSESSYANVTVYTGREVDGETGLYYFRNRYYSAELGRFLSRDPIGYKPGDTNVYRYCRDNPTIYIDPRGLFCGECQPPVPPYRNEYNKKFAGVRVTSGGASPVAFDAGFELLANLATLDDISSIASIITAATQGSMELLQAAIEEAAGHEMDVSGLAPSMLQNFLQAWAGTYGTGIFIEVQYESCDPCTCWNPFAWGGGQKYWWRQHTKFHKCTQGTSDFGTYGGIFGALPTEANMTACIIEALE